MRNTALAPSCSIARPDQSPGRLREPLLTPIAEEREGYVPNVVYSCGALLHKRELILPYAMSDYATNFATLSVDEILAANGMTGAPPD